MGVIHKTQMDREFILRGQPGLVAKKDRPFNRKKDLFSFLRNSTALSMLRIVFIFLLGNTLIAEEFQAPAQAIQVLPKNTSKNSPENKSDIKPKENKFLFEKDLEITRKVAYEDGTIFYSLSNGLDILICPRKGSRTGTVQYISKKTGCLNEQEWTGSGISSLLEFFIANGPTARFSREEIRADLNRLGGGFRSWTTPEYSAFALDAISEKIPEALSVLTDQILNTQIDTIDLNTVKFMMRQEYKGNKSDRTWVGKDLLFQTCYLEHPYRNSGNGSLSLFDQIEQEDLINFYKTRFTPNHLLLGIDGDVVPEKIIKDIIKLYKNIPRGKEIMVPVQKEPEQIAPRRTSCEVSGKVYDLYLAWPTVSFSHKDYAVLDLLRQIMVDENRGRLIRKLKDNQTLLIEADGFLTRPQSVQGIFALHASVLPGQLAALRLALDDEIELLKKEPISTAEINGAKKQIEAAHFIDQSRPGARLDRIMKDFLFTGSPLFNQNYLQRLRSVGTEDLRRVARQYLPAVKRNEILICPSGKSPTFISGSSVNKEENVQIQAYQFKTNKFRLLIKDEGNVPYVLMDFYILCGTLFDTAENAGRSAMLAELIKRGKGSEQSTISDFFDSTGGKFSVSAGRYTLHVSALVLKEDFVQAIQILTRNILDPVFSEENFQKGKRNVLNRIQQRSDSLSRTAEDLFTEQLSSESPLRFLPDGTEKSISQMKLEDLKEFHRSIMVPGKMLVSLFGNTDSSTATSYLGKTFGALPQGKDHPYSFKGSNELMKTIRKEKKGKWKNSAGMIGWPTVSIFEKQDFATLIVLQTILGGYRNTGGKLGRELVDTGWVHDLRTEQMFSPLPSYLYVYFETLPEDLKTVSVKIQQIVEQIKSGGISPDEMERAKEEVLAAEILESREIRKESRRVSLDDLYGLGYEARNEFQDRIRKVQLDDLFLIARKYLKESVFITISPEE